MFDKIDIKKEFYIHFTTEMRRNETISLFYEIHCYGNAYVVGGFFRDFLTNKQSRDIDVIVDIPNDILIDIIKNNNLEYSTNRHGGIKIIKDLYNIDIWTIENNWAFKNKLVKLNEDDKLKSIANGCFYNYDSLVINLSKFSYNIQNFSNFFESNRLDILQTTPKYKNLNPSIEANILRAIYLQKLYGSVVSNNTYYYLYNKVGYLKDKKIDVINHLLKTKAEYKKYEFISKNDLIDFINKIYEEGNPNKQLTIFI